jgi:hypothetical protein
MIINKDKLHYKRNLNIGIIVSLIIITSSFYLSPNFKDEPSEIPQVKEQLITVIDIPRTVQTKSSETVSQPKKIIPSLVVEIDEPEVLQNVMIDDASLDEKSDSKSNNLTSSPQHGDKALPFSSLPFIPRQFLEVLPEKPADDVEGYIKLSLKIGKGGMVKEHRILNNTVKACEECLHNVIEAVYKSKWAPVIIEGDSVQFWLEKTYRFN